MPIESQSNTTLAAVLAFIAVVSGAGIRSITRRQEKRRTESADIVGHYIKGDEDIRDNWREITEDYSRRIKDLEEEVEELKVAITQQSADQAKRLADLQSMHHEEIQAWERRYDALHTRNDALMEQLKNKS